MVATIKVTPRFGTSDRCREDALHARRPAFHNVSRTASLSHAAGRAGPCATCDEETRIMSVTRLSERVRRELTYLSYPSREWTVPRHRDGAGSLMC